MNFTNLTESAEEFDYGTEIPPEFTEISPESWKTIIAYGVIFIAAAVANIIVLVSVTKSLRIRSSPMNILLLHLCIADLGVVFIIIPTEIVWRIFVAWKAGNIMCKIIQFCRAFGLYLSSLILVCISYDRYTAVLQPFAIVKSSERIRLMLCCAWILALFCSLPQLFIFSVEHHPAFKSFEQCKSGALGEKGDFINTIFSLSVMYFLPIIVILFTYTQIIYKIFKESSQFKVPNTSLSKRRSSFQINDLESEITTENSSNNHMKGRREMVLRRSGKNNNMEKAKIRSIQIFGTIIFAFLLTWTPYFIINIWFLVDYNKASQALEPWILDVLFIFAVTNSLANPIIYLIFSRKKTTQRPQYRPNSSMMVTTML